MNAERLHAIARTIRTELDASTMPSLVAQLAQGLQSIVQDPNQSAHQQTVATLREQIEAATESAPSNDFSPAWRQTVEELGITGLLGAQLRRRIDDAFEGNEITVATAAAEVATLSQELAALDTALTQLLAAFDFLAIGAEELAPGEFEIGFLIPREAIDNDLDALGREFVKLNRILEPFLELATGTRPDLNVRSISSSAFQAFLSSTPAMALLLAKTLESLINSYEKIVTMRRSHAELKATGVPDDVLERLVEHVNEQMSRDIDALTEELLAELARRDEERANELRKEIKDALAAIANRIDRGYSVEVRAGEMPPAADDEDEDGADREARGAAEAVIAAQPRLAFTNESGRPILALPEGTDEGSASDDAGADRSSS